MLMPRPLPSMGLLTGSAGFPWSFGIMEIGPLRARGPGAPRAEAACARGPVGIARPGTQPGFCLISICPSVGLGLAGGLHLPASPTHSLLGQSQPRAAGCGLPAPILVSPHVPLRVSAPGIASLHGTFIHHRRLTLLSPGSEMLLASPGFRRPYYFPLTETL